MGEIGATSGCTPGFLDGGGALGALMCEHDWSMSPLGHPDQWPQSLRSIVALMINSRYPMFVAWGPQLAFLYNDGYAPIFGKKHPHMLGVPFREAWSEIWDDIAPLVDRALSGEATFDEDFHLVMERNGYPEDTWYSFSYSPVRDESGQIAGMFCACAETTETVLARRRDADERSRMLRMFDQAPGFMAILQGPDHCITYHNATYAERMGGRSAIGKTVLEAIPEAAGQGFVALLDKVYQTGEPMRLEAARFVARQPDGSEAEQFVDVVYQPLRDAAGKIDGVFIEGYSVTDRLHAQAELRELNEDLAKRVEAAIAERAILADIIDETDAFVQVAAPDYTYLAVNAASARQFKRLFKREARIGENMLDLLAEWPDHQANAKALWGRAFAGESFTQVRELDLGRGSSRYYESRFRPLRNKAGEITAAYQFVTDITDRVRNEARLRTIFDTSFQLQSLMDLDGTLREANATALAAIGQTGEDVIGRKMWATPWFSQTPGLAERVERTISKVARTGKAVRAEIAANFPQGRRVFDFSIRPMLDPGGVAVGLISEATELTALREAEAALLQAQKLESMGQLTGGVAHDFNNLLTPIVGALDLLQRRGIGNELEQSLISGAMQSAERARTLVQRLLAFARRQPLQPVPVDIAKLVLGMADLVERTTGPQVRVVTNVGANLPSAVADANQLELAILNLAVNARDAMPDGGTLRISADERIIERRDTEGIRPGRYVCLSVADGGTGMDAKTRARAIEPFFSTKGVGQGTGLGLSMAHGLASQLGGALTIDSHPGVGTNVMLWLPATEREVAPAALAPAPARLGRGSVLLVDDEPLVRATTAGMLDELGYDVTEAESGEAALAALEGGLAPDFLVTDHLMPGISGTELARAARGQLPLIRVLVISGYAERKGVDPDLARLAKPFRSADLSEAMSGLKPEPPAS